MHWIAPSGKDADNVELDKCLRAAGLGCEGRTARREVQSVRRWPLLPAETGFDFLLWLPENEDIGGRVNTAMRYIEKHNSQLVGVLPKAYNIFTSTLLKELLKRVSDIPASLDYDAFGRILDLDPAAGSGPAVAGFVSSARFVSNHKKNPAAELSIHGVEKTDETGRLCRLNLAIRGIEADFCPEHTNTFWRHLLPELRIPKSWRA